MWQTRRNPDGWKLILAWNRICCTCVDYNTQPILRHSSKICLCKFTKWHQISWGLQNWWRLYCVPYELKFGNRVHSLGVKNMEFVFKVRPQPKSYGIFYLFRECSLQRKKSISVERFLCLDERSGSCQEMCSTPFQTSVQTNLEHQIFIRPREGWGLGKWLKWFIMTKTTGHAYESWYPMYIFQLNLRPE